MIRHVLAASALLTGAGTLTLVSPAAAVSAPCSSSSINPHSQAAGMGVDDAYVARTGTLANRTLRLLYGTRPFDGKQYGWAEISGPTAGSDTVSLQISRTGGTAPLTVCGPFSVDVAGTRGFTRAERTSTSASVVFRACGRLSGGASSCTPWW